jgi:sialidase-1
MMIFHFTAKKSTDNGVSWEPYVDITHIAPPEWAHSFKFIPSGRGIQTSDGTLMHTYLNVNTKQITLFRSTDHGVNWESYGSRAYPSDEAKVVELPNGTLMINSRRVGGYRYVHRSTDGATTWDSEQELGLPDPTCNAGIIQYTAISDGYDKDRLLFVNAASLEGRKNLAVRISYDNGETWSEGKVIDPTGAMYSEIVILPDGTIGVVYEDIGDLPYTIRFVRFTLEALTDNQDSLSKPYELY